MDIISVTYAKVSQRVSMPCSLALVAQTAWQPSTTLVGRFNWQGTLPRRKDGLLSAYAMPVKSGRMKGVPNFGWCWGPSF